MTNYTQQNISSALAKINCPAPDFNTGWDRTNCSHPPASRGSYVNDKFTLWDFNSTVLNTWNAAIPTGWFDYASDWLDSFNEHNAGWAGLMATATSGATPAGFTLLGYHIADLNATAIAFVIMLYGFCYLGIGVLLYKAISPFVRS